MPNQPLSAERARLTLIASGAVPLLLILAGCDRNADEAAGGLSVGENQALDDAAERLEQRSPSPSAQSSEALEQDVRARVAEERANSGTN